MNSKFTYPEFKDAVKQQLISLLPVYTFSGEDLGEFIRREEDEVKSGFARYQNGNDPDLTEEALFKSVASSVAYCMYMLFE